jgi:small subunit ribosomal protein S13
MLILWSVLANAKLVNMGSDAELRRLEKKLEKKEAEKTGKAPEKKKEEKKPVVQKPAETKVKKIVRVADTNVDGDKVVAVAVREIKGIGPMFANAVAAVSGFGDRKLSELTEEEVRKLEEILSSPVKHGIPVWMLNRRGDPQTAENRHLIASSLDFARSTDINEMKKWKTYKGVRHASGLPVRGQRTRSSFRTKGKTVGVQRKKEEPAKAGAKKEEKK